MQDLEIELQDKLSMLKFIKSQNRKSPELKEIERDIKKLEKKIKNKNWE